LLEVAFGQGRVARELARRGAMPTGLDISTALLANVARLLRSGGWFVFSLGPVPVPFYFAARCLLAAR
jgi:ubiquinone/menaquinone biosynthesis C-methylase UbiE